MEAYCMKCKEKREAKDVQNVTMKNGKPAQQGVCPVCGTKMFRIGAPKATETDKAAEPTKASAKAASPKKATDATKAKSESAKK